MIVDNELLPWGAEVINGAIMSGQPVLVIEGITDLNVYRRIAMSTGKDLVVKPVELIRGYGEGCSEVVRLIGDLETSDVTAGSVPGNLIGIIDKDVREQRGEIPESDNIIVLDLYSIESHFVAAEAIPPCLRLSIPHLSDTAFPALQGLLFSHFCASLDILRLASLDALRGAIDSSYSTDFGYSESFDRLKDPNLVVRIREKEADLMSFSNQLGIDQSLAAMKLITKGKVLLDAFVSSILSDLKKLNDYCGNLSIPSCGYCQGGVREKCELRIGSAINVKILKNAILSEFPEAEFSYLIELVKSKAN